MDSARLTEEPWTAERFLTADQAAFGPLWRYELVDGVIIGHAAPAPEHGAILAGLAAALGKRMSGRTDGCRPEIGSGAAPSQQQRATARIPDAVIRCGAYPRVTFEIVSPSELKAWRERDLKRGQVQDVDGVCEMVEFYQEQIAAHVYRKGADGGWSFEAVGGGDAILRLASVDISMPLGEIYRFADLAGDRDFNVPY